VTRKVFLGCVLLSSLAVLGCATREKVRLTNWGAPSYERLHVVYEVRPLSAHAAPEDRQAVQAASYVAGGDDVLRRSVMWLEIEYPCRGVHADFARATLRIVADHPGAKAEPDADDKPLPSSWLGLRIARQRRKPPTAAAHESVQQALVLELPKTELDRVLRGLADEGFFDAEGMSPADSRLSVTYNGVQVAKGWTGEPRLDHLVRLVERHGTPVVDGGR
jgi:hypothetical protein